MLDLEAKLARVRETAVFRRTGKIVHLVGLTIESQGPAAALGEMCWIELPEGGRRAAEVVGFRDSRTLLMPLGELEGIRPGLLVVAEGRPLSVPVSKALLGRVVDGLGRPLDSQGQPPVEKSQPLLAPPPDPLRRERVTTPMPLGVRSVDAFITCGRGQRVGIFGGSGVGKSTLLGMFAKYAKSHLNVIALIGERGREVRDFIERDLGPQGLARSVVVVVTSDQPALLRVKGAQREIGLAVGEPPTTRGYTPSVFSLLPRLLERSGMAEKGSVTGLYTVLVEGDDMNEPVADSARSILDGHIVISRDLAAANHYPAIDILQSLSRVFTEVTAPEHQQAAARLRKALAVYHRARDLLDVGAYVAGSNPEIDWAVRAWPKIQEFLRQAPDDPTAYPEVLRRLGELAVIK